LEKFDKIDIIILGELTQESNISIPKLSEKISINSSVVYSRINRLVRKGFIKKYTLEVDENLLGYPVKAMIGCNISSKQRETILEDIENIEETREIIEITGRFDVLIWISAKSLDDLYELVSKKLPKINGITHTEAFIEMKRHKLNFVSRINSEINEEK
jgi:Lrp/AsnC family transcriptional regulator for asnA, asnC and gidA|tara:strand:- start:183 stop:659 length:477 start_codon:yes stop_codon:yes gene_type:complete